MGLYPATLFHFTKEFENLKGILINSFRPGYARETISGSRSNGESFERDFGVPMVSFCDLRVSELLDHIESYGHFGIGLSKKWATVQKLHPVFYINAQNRLIPDYLGALQARFLKVRESGNITDYFEYREFFNLQSFLKHYEGKLVRADGKTIDPYRFANEREWRYVPDFARADYPLSYVPSHAMKQAAWKSVWRDKIDRKYNLHFEPNDIKYLIVNNDTDAEQLIEFVRDKKAAKFSYDSKTMSLLASRILTYEQILSDI